MHLPQGHTVGQAVGLPWPGGVGTTKAVGAHLDTQDLELVTFPPALWPWSLWAGRGGSVCAGAEAPACVWLSCDLAGRADCAGGRQTPIISLERSHPRSYLPACF